MYDNQLVLNYLLEKIWETSKTMNEVELMDLNVEVLLCFIKGKAKGALMFIIK